MKTQIDNRHLCRQLYSSLDCFGLGCFGLLVRGVCVLLVFGHSVDESETFLVVGFLGFHVFYLNWQLICQYYFQSLENKSFPVKCSEIKFRKV